MSVRVQVPPGGQKAVGRSGRAAYFFVVMSVRSLRLLKTIAMGFRIGAIQKFTEINRQKCIRTRLFVPAPKPKHR